VTTLRGTDITVVGQDRSYHRVTRYAILSSDAVTAVSAYLRDETDRVFGATRPIDVIPNFVDPGRFRPVEDRRRRATFARPDQALLLHVSNFRPVKRAPVCVDVLARVVRDRDAVLVMVGDGPERAECEARARRAGLRDRVRFLGAHADVERLLPVADLFLLPSEYESFGLAVLESMACGTPPVAFRAGGIPEVVTDGEDGLLVAPLDDAALAEAVVGLLADPARRREMALAGRRNAERRFATSSVVPLYEEAYRRVLAAG
jgi:L-malate glycosyltransferase